MDDDPPPRAFLSSIALETYKRIAHNVYWALITLPTALVIIVFVVLARRNASFLQAIRETARKPEESREKVNDWQSNARLPSLLVRFSTRRRLPTAGPVQTGVNDVHATSPSSSEAAQAPGFRYSTTTGSYMVPIPTDAQVTQPPGTHLTVPSVSFMVPFPTSPEANAVTSRERQTEKTPGPIRSVQIELAMSVPVTRIDIRAFTTDTSTVNTLPTESEDTITSADPTGGTSGVRDSAKPPIAFVTDAPSPATGTPTTDEALATVYDGPVAAENEDNEVDDRPKEEIIGGDEEEDEDEGVVAGEGEDPKNETPVDGDEDNAETNENLDDDEGSEGQAAEAKATNFQLPGTSNHMAIASTAMPSASSGSDGAGDQAPGTTQVLSPDPAVEGRMPPFDLLVDSAAILKHSPSVSLTSVETPSGTSAIATASNGTIGAATGMKQGDRSAVASLVLAKAVGSVMQGPTTLPSGSTNRISSEASTSNTHTDTVSAGVVSAAPSSNTTTLAQTQQTTTGSFHPPGQFDHQLSLLHNIPIKRAQSPEAPAPLPRKRHRCNPKKDLVSEAWELWRKHEIAMILSHPKKEVKLTLSLGAAKGGQIEGNEVVVGTLEGTGDEEAVEHGEPSGDEGISWHDEASGHEHAREGTEETEDEDAEEIAESVTESEIL